MKELVNVQNEDLAFILKRVDGFGGIHRLGMLFSTQQNHYFYDNGTGKVAQLDSGEYRLFEWLYAKNHSHGYGELMDFLQCDDPVLVLSNVRSIVTQEHLLMAPFITVFMSPDHKENLDEVLDRGVRIITLELTQQCNLRCDYCVYNESYGSERNFSSKDMTKETVKASIDYIANYQGDELAITFYGGEPLLRFDLIKYGVEYAQSTIKDKKITYSMTTNLTLMTKEMAEFFASVEGFGITCSIDGPENVHDQYRKYPDGRGSFHDAMRGLRHLADAYDKETFASIISFSMVFAPPYSAEKLSEIQSFFESLDWLPTSLNKHISYPSAGSVKDEIIDIQQQYRHMPDTRNPLLSWVGAELTDGSDWDELFTKTFLTEALLPIHKRPLSHTPIQTYGFNGSCVPGSQRLYICADGGIKLCSMIHTCPMMGNIHDGLDREKVKEHYIDKYETESVADCNDCWAFKICKVCYAGSYNACSFDIDKKREKCNDARSVTARALREYHEFLEKYPERMILFNEMTLG
ncbi:MAG: radical SAM protein [Lachnospiraceae bacterium]|jgi:uncharacterized protein|nr:radical SAM protein [Lachnospiraceae bacterium]